MGKSSSSITAIGGALGAAAAAAAAAAGVLEGGDGGGALDLKIKLISPGIVNVFVDNTSLIKEAGVTVVVVVVV